MEDFRKVVRIGTFNPYGSKAHSAYARISLTDGKLSIVGVLGPTQSGGAQSCGQCYDSFKNVSKFAKGWNFNLLKDFVNKWKLWHLNDMQAGSPRQMEWIRENGKGMGFDEIIKKMPTNILNDEEYFHNGKPYIYGTAWLRKEVPDEVLEWFKALPDADKACPWNNL